MREIKILESKTGFVVWEKVNDSTNSSFHIDWSLNDTLYFNPIEMIKYSQIRTGTMVSAQRTKEGIKVRHISMSGTENHTISIWSGIVSPEWFFTRYGTTEKILQKRDYILFVSNLIQILETKFVDDENREK